jgi:hypothetical protein
VFSRGLKKIKKVTKKCWIFSCDMLRYSCLKGDGLKQLNKTKKF